LGLGLDVFDELIMLAQTFEPARTRQAALLTLAGALRGRAAMRTKIDDLLLMPAKNPENSTRRQQRQVDKRAKAAVADQDVARRQIGMDSADAGHVVCAHRRRNDVEQKPGRRMEERQQMHHGKATP